MQPYPGGWGEFVGECLIVKEAGRAQPRAIAWICFSVGPPPASMGGGMGVGCNVDRAGALGDRSLVTKYNHYVGKAASAGVGGREILT